MPELLVGCPIRHRAWAVQPYVDHVIAACKRAEVEPAFLFAGDPTTDAGTWEAIEDHVGPRLALPVVVEEWARIEAGQEHRWNPDRFHHMVMLRNEVLAEVRDLAPRWFLSLDSDILLHPDALVQLLDTLDGLGRYDAVGGKTYLTAGTTDNSSYAMIEQGTLIRREFAGIAPVDVIMAIKLMAPVAYHVDYAFHHFGEDVGWSIAARRAGVRLGFNGTVVSKHVRSPADLELVDVRAGY